VRPSHGCRQVCQKGNSCTSHTHMHLVFERSASNLLLHYPQMLMQALMQSNGKSIQCSEAWLIRVQAGVLTSMRLGLGRGRSGRLATPAEQCQHITCTRALRCVPTLPHIPSRNISDWQPEVLL